MVYSKKEGSGKAFLVPLKQAYGIGTQMKQAIKVEGIYGGDGVRLYGTKGNTWGMISIAVKNPKYKDVIENIVKSQLIDEKSNQGNEKKSAYEIFKETYVNRLNEEMPVKENGLLKIDVPEGFDYVLTTLTLPDKEQLVLSKIRESVKDDKSRYYFFNNIRHGISTKSDVDILEKIGWTPSQSFKLTYCQYIMAGELMLIFSTKGTLLLYNSRTSKLLWESPLDKNGDRAEFQDDGNLVIYKGDKAPWASGTCCITNDIERKLGDNLKKQIQLTLHENKVNIKIERCSEETSRYGSITKINLPTLTWSSSTTTTSVIPYAEELK